MIWVLIKNNIIKMFWNGDFLFMDSVKIIGSRYFSFKGEDGRQVEGYVCHFIFESTSSRVFGYGVDYFTLRPDLYKSYDIDHLISSQTLVRIYYNKYGKVSSIVPVNA